jgi:hypothetical protein
MDTYNYDELFCKLPPENTYHGDTCPGPQAYFRGETYMKNAKLHLGWQVICGPMPMEEPHFHHGVEEYLVFFGAQLPDVWASWDAEIDIMIGEDRDNMHKYTITQPTIVRIPPNMWHCPINFRKINKPVLWQAIYEDGTWARISRRTREDGSKEYIYDGDNIRMCVKNPSKRCVLCGECFQALPQDMAQIT